MSSRRSDLNPLETKTGYGVAVGLPVVPRIEEEIDAASLWAQLLQSLFLVDEGIP